MNKSTYDIRREKVLNDAPVGLGPVLYVMARDQRVEDNWALIRAAIAASERQVPLLVVFALAPMFNNGSARHNEWMLASLKEVAQGCKNQSIPFTIIYGAWESSIKAFVQEYGVGEVIFDFNPLEPVRTWRESVAATLPVKVSVVDARNIVPCFVASQKAEFAAYTFRPRVTKLVPEFLTKFPTIPPTLPFHTILPEIDWEAVRAYRQCDYSEPLPERLVPGASAAKAVLDDFITHRLVGYSTRRNDPTIDGVSDLSPYLRWGNISAARVALVVQASDTPKADREAFLEELIVRRELSDNFCYYTREHTTVAAAHAWARQTIAEHAVDKREYIYTYEQFRDSLTHDDLWNAAQRQMVEEGKMHGFLRMYWAKKILEWTPDAQTAIDVALRLNDRYELDGRDSNGVAGVMWSICGVHDRAWNTRPIFGKIRYMNYAGCKRKFDVKAFVAKYSHQTETSLF
jgi:deoxyribodipyrimidine photo-lyase